VRKGSPARPDAAPGAKAVKNHSQVPEGADGRAALYKFSLPSAAVRRAWRRPPDAWTREADRLGRTDKRDAARVPVSVSGWRGARLSGRF